MYVYINIYIKPCLHNNIHACMHAYIHTSRVLPGMALAGRAHRRGGLGGQRRVVKPSNAQSTPTGDARRSLHERRLRRVCGAGATIAWRNQLLWSLPPAAVSLHPACPPSAAIWFGLPGRSKPPSPPQQNMVTRDQASSHRVVLLRNPIAFSTAKYRHELPRCIDYM